MSSSPDTYRPREGQLHTATSQADLSKSPDKSCYGLSLNFGRTKQFELVQKIGTKVDCNIHVLLLFALSTGLCNANADTHGDHDDGQPQVAPEDTDRFGQQASKKAGQASRDDLHLIGP